MLLDNRLKEKTTAWLFWKRSIAQSPDPDDHGHRGL